MNPTIVGVILGSSIPLVAGLLQFLLAWWKERQHWERERQLANEKWNREALKEEVALLRDLYQNTLHSLANVPFNGGCDEEVAKASAPQIQEANRYLALLVQRHPTPDFKNTVRQFRDSPTLFVNDTYDIVLDLASEEHALFTHAPGRPALPLLPALLSASYEFTSIKTIA